MLPKKRQGADLEKKKSLFFEIGLAITLLLVLIAFKWRVPYEETTEIVNFKELSDVDEIVPITRQEPEKLDIKPPVQVKLQDIITIVENNSEDTPDLEIKDDQITEDSEIEIQTTEVVSYDEEEIDETEVFVVVEDMPIFRPDICKNMTEGNIELNKYIHNTIKYPVIAQENGITGRVFVSFVVGRKGEVKDIKILRGIDPSLDKEAIRVIQSLPAFSPGKQRGVPVQVTYSTAINFVLQ